MVDEIRSWDSPPATLSVMWLHLRFRKAHTLPLPHTNVYIDPRAFPFVPRRLFPEPFAAIPTQIQNFSNGSLIAFG